MNKLLVALIAGAFASVAAAQTAPPKPTSQERQRDLKSTTEAAAAATTGAQTAKEQAANVQKSKQVAKLSKEEKTKLAKDATKLNVNPENSAGQAATAEMQRQTTAVSKATSKQNTEFKSKGGQQQLAKDLRAKSTQ